MIDLSNAKEFLILLKDKTVQVFIGFLVIGALSFWAGRATAPLCIKSVVCEDISKDRDKLSEQLKTQRTECATERKKALQKLRQDLNAECALDIEEASDGSDFDPDIHCPICKIRGVCK